jgi:hypothetical protein
MSCVRKVAGRDEDLVDVLAEAVEAIADGYALLVFAGDYDGDVEEAAQRAGAATLALIRGRQLLRR